MSYDAGRTWVLASEGVWHNLLLVPLTPPVLYAYGWRGMMRSTDGGYHWESPAGALAHSLIGSMAGATTTDRVVIYIGTSGGMVSGGVTQMWNLASGNQTLVNAGVYRQTTRLLNRRVYLPIVLRQG